MIARLIEYSIRNRFIVILLTAAVAVWGVYAVLRTPVDAIPDLSENQVIVFADWMGRSPKEIDDQVTYPLSVSLQGLSGVKEVRANSEFNFAMITVIFDDSVDFYFARTRVLERLEVASTQLPAGVVPYLAPDATALGQIFWYTVEGDGYDLAQLRGIQDWYVRYQLYVPGVAEVASVGGFVREYQVDVDPRKLRAYELPLGEVYEAIARSNVAVGGKVYYEGGAEFLIRGVGWLRGVPDLENVVVAERDGVPIYVRNLAAVQMGPQFRRSSLEKDGQEAVGGVVLMRYGENPLDVTRAIKKRIEELQPGLPPGVRIVPFYERTHLIQGAIHTLTGTLTEEIIIASLAVILILMHFRAALLVCLTLPLAVLVSFLFMYYLDIPSNIMSLAGIAISIGVLVDSGIVMVENAMHELGRTSEGGVVRGDTTEVVIKACSTVGKPIFFSVMIMLLSFLPVFALGGMEGRMFRPLAFTKTFAMLGVAVLAITFVPAMIPFLIRGRIRREEENWIVRSFINIYRPMLTWLMRVPAAGLWFMALLMIIGLGLAGIFGKGAAWPALVLLAVFLFVGAVFFRRWWGQAIALALLVIAAAWAWQLPKLGREFMPPLDEGSILDMPVTVPRVSVAQATEDMKVRNAVMRSFPEVDLVVGKAGRAETPTDPSGIDMVETIVTLRPKGWWPKRKLRFEDATAQARTLIAAMQDQGFVRRDLDDDQRTKLITTATMDAVEEFDRGMRDLALRRQAEHEPVLARTLVRATVDDLLAHFRAKGELRREPRAHELDKLTDALTKDHGLLLVETPRQEQMNSLITAATQTLAALGVVTQKPDLLLPRRTPWLAARNAVVSAVGGEEFSVFRAGFEQFEKRRDRGWTQRIKQLNWELEDQAGDLIARTLLEALRHHARGQQLLAQSPSDAQLKTIRDAHADTLMQGVFLWHKDKANLVQEMNSELQMPGWGNIWTQPIINRVDMLATGVRTMIGVKVFGPRLEDRGDEPGIQTISNQIAAALRDIPGAVDVFPDQVVGRSYLQIDIDREQAARYGVNVSELEEAIEVAMGGRTITTTVEGRERYPVRVRYARDFWQTREALANVLVTGRRQGDGPPTQIPISQVARIKVLEGPSMIKSENGMLRAYVQLNVRDRDIVGFVEEAQRVVAGKVALPPGFFIKWSGQFEQQVRARRTLTIIFPLVILLIFVILYVTFNDWRDALLIMLAVPGAVMGGIIFQSLFGFNFSVAVWVGYIACFGLATETGIVMLVYLREALSRRGGLASIASEREVTEAVIEGAVHRLRPKLMTEATTIVALMPMLWATGVGAEVIRPMAAPVLGGILVADEVIDLLLPVIFNWYQVRRWRKLHPAAA